MWLSYSIGSLRSAPVRCVRWITSFRDEVTVNRIVLDGRHRVFALVALTPLEQIHLHVPAVHSPVIELHLPQHCAKLAVQ